MKLYDKTDLLKLKESKPVPIIAHTNEIVVPVVYASMVKQFLDKKGVTLPLTHHQLADMKREAQSLAKGGTVRQKVKQSVRFSEPKPEPDPEGNPKPKKAKKAKKKGANKSIKQKGKYNQVAQQRVVIHLGDTKKLANPSMAPYHPPNNPNPAQPQRPNYFNEIRPHSTAPMMLAPPDDREEERKQQEKRDNEAFERYFKDAGHRRNVIYEALARDPRARDDNIRQGGNFDFEIERYNRPIIEVIEDEKPPKEPPKEPEEAPKEPEEAPKEPEEAPEEKEPERTLSFTDWVKANRIYDRGRKYGPASDPRQKQYMAHQRENYQRYLRKEPAFPFVLKEEEEESESDEEEPEVQKQSPAEAEAVYKGLLAKRAILLRTWQEDRGGPTTKKRKVLDANIRELFRDLQDYEGQPFYKSSEVDRKAFFHFRF